MSHQHRCTACGNGNGTGCQPTRPGCTCVEACGYMFDHRTQRWEPNTVTEEQCRAFLDANGDALMGLPRIDEDEAKRKGG